MKQMKMNSSCRVLGTLVLLLSSTILFAQSKTERSSPPMESSATVNGSEVTINYSAPSKKDREIFGQLVPYDKVWRTGANEATTITLEKDMTVEGKTLKAGKYGLFTVPGKSSWEIIFNEVWDQWGHYNYDADKDVLRISVSSKELSDSVEQMRIDVDKNGVVSIQWDTTAVSFTLK
jgi:hypothetical protein